MSRRQFLNSMRLDTRNDGSDSRRESLIASPIHADDDDASKSASDSNAAESANHSGNVLFTSHVAPPSNGDTPATAAAARDADSADALPGRPSCDSDVPSPTAVPAEEELDPLLMARPRSNTMPFNYRSSQPQQQQQAGGDELPAAPPLMQNDDSPRPSSAVAPDDSPYSAPRTARPGGSRVPTGPVPIRDFPRPDFDGASSPDEHTVDAGQLSSKDTPRPCGAEGGFGQYMRRRSLEKPDATAAPVSMGDDRRSHSPPPDAPGPLRSSSSPSSPPRPEQDAAATITTATTVKSSLDGFDPAEFRARSGSITRIENSLVAVQIELAREKKNNIDAEQRLLALGREVESLRSENTRLAAVAARRGSDSLELPSDASAGGAAGSARYIEELERTVRQLSQSIATKDAELASRDERIRLLEHRLVDKLLAGGDVSPARGGGELPGASQPVARASSPSTSPSHVREVRASDLTPYDSRAVDAVVTVPSRKLDDGSREREVGSSALRRRATDLAIGTSDATPGTTVATMLSQPSHTGAATSGRRDGSPRPRANSAMVSSTRESGSAVRRRGSAVRRKDSDTSALERHRGSHAARITPTVSPSATAPPTASTGPRRKSSIIGKSADTSANQPAPSTSLTRRASASGPRASPLRRNSSARRDSTASAATTSQSTTTGVETARTGSARRRSSVNSSVNSGSGASKPPRRPSAAHPVQLQRAPNVSAQDASISSNRRSMIASYTTPHRVSTSPTRSTAPSMRSATSTRSRPQISFNTKDDVMTMKGTTTTVVFRSRSPGVADISPTRSPYAAALTPERDTRPFVSDQFSETTYHPNRLVRTPQEMHMEATEGQ